MIITGSPHIHSKRSQQDYSVALSHKIFENTDLCNKTFDCVTVSSNSLRSVTRSTFQKYLASLWRFLVLNATAKPDRNANSTRAAK